MKERLLDIIVVTYNQSVELDLIMLNLLDIEDVNLIIVNDGSKDKDAYQKVLEKYKDYDNFEYYHKENYGSSSARNFGLTKSISQYITFLDGDDIFIPSGLSKAIDHIKKTLKKAYQWNGYYVYRYEKNEISQILSPEPFDIEKAKYRNLPGTIGACFFVLHRELYLKNNLFFNENLIKEDIDWFVRLLFYVKKIYIMPIEVFVYYRDNPGSIMNNIKTNKLWQKRYNEDMIKTIENIEELKTQTMDENVVSNLDVFIRDIKSGMY